MSHIAKRSLNNPSSIVLREREKKGSLWLAMWEGPNSWLRKKAIRGDENADEHSQKARWRRTGRGKEESTAAKKNGRRRGKAENVRGYTTTPDCSEKLPREYFQEGLQIMRSYGAVDGVVPTGYSKGRGNNRVEEGIKLLRKRRLGGW